MIVRRRLLVVVLLGLLATTIAGISSAHDTPAKAVPAQGKETAQTPPPDPLAGIKSGAPKEDRGDSPGRQIDEASLEEAGETGAVLRRLADDEGAFSRAIESFRKHDAEGLREVLERFGLTTQWHLVCRWLCVVDCVRVCRIVCAHPLENDFSAEELREFASRMSKLAADESNVKRLFAAVEHLDASGFKGIVDEFKLGRFCWLLCHWVCYLRCEWFCVRVPPTPDPAILAEDPIVDFRDSSLALARLAEDEPAFLRAVKAVEVGDANALREVLDGPRIQVRCFLLCRWFCFWHCVRVCRLVCRDFPEIELTIPDLREVTGGIYRLTSNPELLTQAFRAIEEGKAEMFDGVLERVKLQRFCYYVCYWLCHLHCIRFCHIVCPPLEPLPVFRRIGGYAYLTQVDSGPMGDGRTLADDRAFYDTMRLNGALYKTLSGSPLEYRFEIRALPGLVWNPVLPPQIARTVIGSWTRWSATGIEFKDYTVNGSAGPGEVTVIAAPDGWIQVPQVSDFWNPLGPGFFTPNGNMINLRSDLIAPWPDINLSGITAGQSTAPAGLGVDQHFSIRMRVRKVGIPASEMSGGLCENAAIYNRNYDSVTHGGSWAPSLVPDQLGAAMVNILEIGPGCAEITNALTVKYTAAHPNLGSVTLGMSGPGGPYTFTMVDDGGATPQNRYGHATPGFTVASLQPCAYLVTLSVPLLLTTGDSVPLPLIDQIAFCKR